MCARRGVRTNFLTALQCIRQNGFVVIVIGLFIHLNGQVVHSYFCIVVVVVVIVAIVVVVGYFALFVHRINCIVYHRQWPTTTIAVTITVTITPIVKIPRMPHSIFNAKLISSAKY